MPTPRYRYMAAIVNGIIYYVGGRNLMNDSIITTMDVYNIATASWNTYQQPESIITSDGAAFVIGTKIFVTGGYDPVYNSLNSTIVLDTTDGTNLFRAGGVAAKSIGSGENGALTINNLGYVVGGWNDGNWEVPLKTLEVYDPVNNSWTRKPDFLTGRGDMGVATVEGYLFVAGGETKTPAGESVPVGNVEEYNPANESWVERTSIAESRFRFTCASYSTYIYDLGGQGTPTTWNNVTYWPILDHNYAFDLSSNSPASIFFPNFFRIALFTLPTIGLLLS